MADEWPTRRFAVASVHLDERNPRLGRETSARAPREILQYLFDHDNALEVAQSIATRGYFPNEPLLGIRENNKIIAVEGNRRLASLKALREPGLLEGRNQRAIERLVQQIPDIRSISTVPVTIAPSRRATDRQIAGRHIGTPVLAWQAENRASFILDKLTEGYSNDELRASLGFSSADIQKARQTRAIADMARSVDLPDEVKAKLDNPRAKVFTTLERVFNSTVGREFLQVEPDTDHGLRGGTTASEFVRGFSKLVADIALGKESSRTLNRNEDIRRYFESWDSHERPDKKRGTFVPADIIKGKSAASSHKELKSEARRSKSKSDIKTVLPKDFKIKFGSHRLVDIRDELSRLRREKFPNAGAVLLRVFFELAVMDFLERRGDLRGVIDALGGKGKLPYGTPSMKQLMPAILKVAKDKLSVADANKVEKAIRYDAAAPFTVSDLHAFVHQSADPPSARDIWQFWVRTEPLFRLMLEQDIGGGS